MILEELVPQERLVEQVAQEEQDLLVTLEPLVILEPPETLEALVAQVQQDPLVIQELLV